MANLPTSIKNIFYQTAASSAVTINDQTAPLTVDTEDNGGGFALAARAPVDLRVNTLKATREKVLAGLAHLHAMLRRQCARAALRSGRPLPASGPARQSG